MTTPEASVNRRPPRKLRWIVITACLAMALAVPGYFHFFKSQPSAREIARAEDEVYEAVVRDILSKVGDQTHGLQLVFDDRLIVVDFPGGDPKSCREASAATVRVTDDRPPFNTAADKTYQFFTSGLYYATSRSLAKLSQTHLHRWKPISFLSYRCSAKLRQRPP